MIDVVLTLVLLTVALVAMFSKVKNAKYWVIAGSLLGASTTLSGAVSSTGDAATASIWALRLLGYLAAGVAVVATLRGRQREISRNKR